MFFDGVNVEEYCYAYQNIANLFSFETSQELLDYPGSTFEQGINGVHFATALRDDSTGSTDDLKTSDTGNVYIEFRMPDGMFRVGDRKFEITSDPRNNKERASTYASGVYSASGLRTEMEETIATTRNFQINDSMQSETRNFSNTSIR